MESGQGKSQGSHSGSGDVRRHLARGVIIFALADLGTGKTLERQSSLLWWKSDKFLETCEWAGWPEDWVNSLFDGIFALREDPESVRKSVTSECVRVLKQVARED